jgi:hypothetical protein
MSEAGLPTSSPPARAGRRWLRITLLVLLPLGLLTGIYAYLALSADWELQQAIAEADRLEPDGWRLQDLGAAQVAIADEENSALVVLAAHRLMPNRWADQLLFRNPFSDPPPPEVQLDETQVAAVRAEVQKCTAALPLARRLAELPSGRHVINWTPDYIDTAVPHLQAVRDVTHLLQYDAWLRAHDEETGGALDSVRAAFCAARSLGDESYTQLVRASCREPALLALERVLGQGEPSAEALEMVQQLLEDEERLPTLLVYLRGERARIDQFMQGIQAKGVDSAFASFKKMGIDQGIPPTEKASLYSPGAVKRQRAALLRYLTRAVEAAKLPPELQEGGFQEAFAGRMAEPRLVTYLTVNTVVRVEQRGRAPAQLRCAIAAVAAERFRQEHGRWPDSLKELVAAGFLGEVPADPYDGAPLRFRRLDYGLVVYALGPDGKDDGGTLIRKAPAAEGPDVGFRLWNAAQRRQPPKPPRAGQALGGPPGEPGNFPPGDQQQ